MYKQSWRPPTDWQKTSISDFQDSSFSVFRPERTDGGGRNSGNLKTCEPENLPDCLCPKHGYPKKNTNQQKKH